MTERQIAAALRGTVLDGHAVEEGLGGTFLVDDVDPTDLVTSWQAARRTGRHPVFTLPGDLDHEPEPAELASLDQSARTTDPWSVYRRADYQQEVERYVAAFLGPGMVDRAVEQLPRPTTDAALQRWVYDTVLADPSPAARVAPGFAYLIGTKRWHTWPEVQLVLLPTTSSWLAPAWVNYFGAARPDGQAAWAAALWQWDQHWGAGLVAAWGTMLQLLTTRRPAPGDQAWQLAGQLLAVGGSLECEQWQLAIALTQDDAWFLHDRP
ncbi:DUF4253 domain-containing protein [Paractinoplanes durhamensis]|uniref:DUF4253 domain-containing protein n=1 Tax=Paractinoplanes durhamensis TaxID=113563 RepID=A0ABQ3YV54_9ACTN|nr:DUF4253 domain-containing protein [Actinoplanes durhamensis]GIE01458.1 hypothetical protein Adu01nite_28080 [Actinoplanes durhamensis]